MPGAGIRGITIDVSNREAAERFWGGVLELEVTGRLDEYSYFQDETTGLRIILQVVDEPKVVKNRVHLDLTSPDPTGLLELVQRLGGSLVSEVATDDYALTVAADPDGNEFCVSTRLSSALTDD